MSFSYGSNTAVSHDQTSEHAPNQNAEGQRHDRVPDSRSNTGKMSKSGALDVTLSQRMMSAVTGSVLTSLLVTPLDVVRVRLQAQAVPAPHNLSPFAAYGANFKHLPSDLGVSACCREVFFVGDNAQVCLAGNSHASSATAADCAVEEVQRKTYTSTYDGMRKIARNEGAAVLWRGLTPTLLMAIPANVIYFTGYDWLRYSDRSIIKQVSGDTYTPLVAGSIARVLSGIAVSPIEMFRTRMQATSNVSSGVFRDTLVGLYKMTQTQGYTSLWRGLTLTMWRDVPFSGFYWWGYEALRNKFMDARRAAKGKYVNPDKSLTAERGSNANEDDSVTFTDSFVAGAIAGAIAAFVTTPFDVGKTRQQVYRHAGDESKNRAAAEAAMKTGRIVPEELSMPRFLYHIFKEESFSGLFKGWGARCMKVAPACAIMISSYEVGKKWAIRVNSRRDEKAAAAAI